MSKEERGRRWARRQRYLEPLHVDLSEVENEEEMSEVDANAPLRLGKRERRGHLIARGNSGGMGNPNFVSQTRRPPKFAKLSVPCFRWNSRHLSMLDS